MSSRVDPILDLIDAALDGHELQRTTEASYGDDLGEDACWRCGEPSAHDSTSGLCGACRSFLLEDTDDDPAVEQSGPPYPLVDWRRINREQWERGLARFTVYDEIHQWSSVPSTLPLRLSFLGGRTMGFLGDRLIRPRTVEMADETDYEIHGFLPNASRYCTPPRQQLSITLDGTRYEVVEPDADGIAIRWEHRDRGHRAFQRITAQVRCPPASDGRSGLMTLAEARDIANADMTPEEAAEAVRQQREDREFYERVRDRLQ